MRLYVRLFGAEMLSTINLDKLPEWKVENYHPVIHSWSAEKTPEWDRFIFENGYEIEKRVQAIQTVWPDGGNNIAEDPRIFFLSWMEIDPKDDYLSQSDFDQKVMKELARTSFDVGRRFGPVEYTRKLMDHLVPLYPLVVSPNEDSLIVQEWVEKMERCQPGELAKRAWEATKGLV